MGKLDERGFLLVVVVPILACAYLLVTLTSFLVLRDTWESENKGRLIALAKKMDSASPEDALAAAREILDIARDRPLKDAQLAEIKDSAKVKVVMREAAIGTEQSESTAEAFQNSQEKKASVEAKRPESAIGRQAALGDLKSGSSAPSSKAKPQEVESALEANRRKAAEDLAISRQALIDWANSALTIESTSVTRTSEIEVPTGEKKKVFFQGFNTPANSEAEYAVRLRRLEAEYPFEDSGGRRYKLVQPTEKKRQSKEVQVVNVSISRKLGIGRFLYIFSNSEIDGVPQSLPEGAKSIDRAYMKFYAKKTGYMGSGIPQDKEGDTWSCSLEDPSGVPFPPYFYIAWISEKDRLSTKCDAAAWIVVKANQPARCIGLISQKLFQEFERTKFDRTR